MHIPSVKSVPDVKGSEKGGGQTDYKGGFCEKDWAKSDAKIASEI